TKASKDSVYVKPVNPERTIMTSRTSRDLSEASKNNQDNQAEAEENNLLFNNDNENNGQDDGRDIGRDDAPIPNEYNGSINNTRRHRQEENLGHDGQESRHRNRDSDSHASQQDTSPPTRTPAAVRSIRLIG